MRADFDPGPLLRTLAQSLDVREVFARISEEARRTVPHDFLYLGLLTDDRERIRLVALSGELPDGLGEIAIPDSLRTTFDHDVIVLNDVALQTGRNVIAGRLRTGDGDGGRQVEMEVQPVYHELAVVRGFRSFLRVTVRLRGGVLGSLVFCSTMPDAYPAAEVDRARQIADCVALALAHQRLAEEQQRTVEARERAARLEERVQRLTDELDENTRRRTVGHCKAWRDALSQATKVAPTEATVLLTGESGTGKEVVARFIHHASRRKAGPFVALNCAALPEQLLEAELFGYERGAFTGAMQSKPGHLEQASGGLLFLDEVGEMSLQAQAKFLRVLQEREFQRLGGTRVLRTDARIVAATNRDLQKAMEHGQFREDLFYRLNVFAIRLPPLRDRRDDILPLSEVFLSDLGRALGRPPSGLSREARQMLIDYHWPGNVRELRNILERAAILCEGGLITPEHLSLNPVMVLPRPASVEIHALPAAPPAAPAPGENIQDVERTMIERALQHARFNKSKAARDLGLSRHQLYVRMRRYGLE